MNIFKLFTKDSSPININDVDHIKDIEIDMDISDIDVNISEIYDTAHKQVMRDILTKKLHKLLQNYTFGKDVVDETAKAKYLFYKMLKDTEDSYKSSVNDNIFTDVYKKYPNARVKSDGRGHRMFSYTVTANDIVEKLIEQLLNK